MKNLSPSKLIDKLGSLCGTLSVAIALGTSLVWADSAKALGFNTGASFTRNVWGSIVGNNTNNINPADGDTNTTSDTTTIIFGPGNGMSSISYMDYFYFNNTSKDAVIQFAWTLTNNDTDANDDPAGYFKLTGGYTETASPTYILDDGTTSSTPIIGNPFDGINPGVASSSGLVTPITVSPGDTFVFRVFSNSNNIDTADFTISQFDVQFIPFDFAPTYGVIFVGTALGINEWRKKRQASKKDETEEKL